MRLAKTDLNLLLLLLLNVILFSMHIAINCQDIFYFFQLTIIGQIIVIINFSLSMFLHQKKSGKKTKLFLSRLHLAGLSIQTVVVLGFWSLRIFFTKGIYKEGIQIQPFEEFLSFWVHGGNFITMFYFIKIDQIVVETSKKIKYMVHLLWGIPFLFLQYFKFYLTGEHVYEFLKLLTWVQIGVFYLSLYFVAVGIDYVLTIRHGLKLIIKRMDSNKQKLQDLEAQKQMLQKQEYEAQINQTKNKKIA